MLFSLLHFYSRVSLTTVAQHIVRPMLRMFNRHHKLNWLELHAQSELDAVLSSDKTVAIFKHSTRCPISSMAKNRIERSWESANPSTPIYLLDLIRYRNLSNHIEDSLDVQHESPQLILVKNKKAVYSSSHSAIDANEVAKHI